MSLVLATGSYDYKIKFWDPSSNSSPDQIDFAAQKIVVNKLAISEDKTKLAAGYSTCAKVYDIQKDNAIIRTFDNFENRNVTAIGFQKNCKWIHTACEDGTIRILDLRSKKEARTYKNNKAIYASVLHPNEVEIICGDQGGWLKVYDLEQDKLKIELPSKDQIGIRSLSISMNAKFLMSCDSAGYVYPYYLENTEHLVPSKRFSAHDDYILKVQIAQNNKYVATCSADKKIKIWTLKENQNEKELHFTHKSTLKGHNKWVWDCDFSCDSVYLISASTDTTVRLWEVETGETVQILRGHTKGVTCLALNDVESI